MGPRNFCEIPTLPLQRLFDETDNSEGSVTMKESTMKQYIAISMMLLSVALLGGCEKKRL